MFNGYRVSVPKMKRLQIAPEGVAGLKLASPVLNGHRLQEVAGGWRRVGSK